MFVLQILFQQIYHTSHLGVDEDTMLVGQQIQKKFVQGFEFSTVMNERSKIRSKDQLLGFLNSIPQMQASHPSQITVVCRCCPSE